MDLNRLRDLTTSHLAKTGLSQTQFANTIGISRTALSRFLSEDSGLSGSAALSILNEVSRGSKNSQLKASGSELHELYPKLNKAQKQAIIALVKSYINDNKRGK